MVVTSRTRLATALAVVAVSVALPFARTPAAPASTATFSAMGLSFRYPANWQTATSNNDVSSFSALIVYLSTSRLRPPCAFTTSPGLRQMACPYPLAEVPPGGVLVRWAADGSPAPRLPNPNVTIGGHPAIEFKTSQDGWCQALEGTETIRVMIPRTAPGNWYEMDACLRPPNLPHQEAQIAAMLSTVHLADGN
jgi:hypothetical protein